MARPRLPAAILFGLTLMTGPALAQESAQPSPGFLNAMKESLFGDVYATPSKWQPLSVGTFFSEGWNRPWASPPPGEGGAPRQGWLNAYDGVFYRLAIVTGGYANDYRENGNLFTGGLSVYAPFNSRFEVRVDVPFVASSRDTTGDDYHTNFGDFQITPRLLLSESVNFTQSLNMTFRMPTGSQENGNGLSSGTPDWEFWWNAWDKLVLRGGAGFAIAFSDITRNAVVANLAAGYYFTRHDFTPLGDLVAYVSANWNQPVDDDGSKSGVVTLTPGFRTHLGANWYLLGGVEVPVTSAKSFDFQVLWGLMKVY